MLNKIFIRISALFFCIQLNAQIDLDVVWALAHQNNLYHDFTFFQPVIFTPDSCESSIGVFSCNSICYDDEQVDAFACMQFDATKDYYVSSMGKDRPLSDYKLESDHFLYDDIFVLDTSWLAQINFPLQQCLFSFSQDYLVAAINGLSEEKIVLSFPRYDLLNPIKVEKSKETFSMVIYNNTPQAIHVVPSKMLHMFDSVVPITIPSDKNANIGMHIITRFVFKNDEYGNLYKQPLKAFYQFDNHILIYISGVACQGDQSDMQSVALPSEKIVRISLYSHSVTVRQTEDGDLLVDSF